MYFRTLLGSRVYGFVLNNLKTVGIVPYADMINHGEPANCEWFYDDDQKSFIMSASTDIKQGDEIVLSYGQKSNSKYFILYGFLNPSKEEDEVSVCLTLDSKDKLYKEKLGMLP